MSSKQHVAQQGVCVQACAFVCLHTFFTVCVLGDRLIRTMMNIIWHCKIVRPGVVCVNVCVLCLSCVCVCVCVCKCVCVCVCVCMCVCCFQTEQ